MSAIHTPKTRYCLRRLKLFWRRNYAMLIFLALASLIIFYAVKVEPDRVVTREITFSHEAVTDKLDNTVIAFIADIHHCPRREKLLNKVINSIHSRRVDVILIGGDLINGGGRNRQYGIKEVLSKLSQLKAPGGVYTIPGNHEYRRNFSAIESAFKQFNMDLMQDESQIITTWRGGKFNLIGMDYAVNPHRRRDTQRSSRLIKPDMFNLILTHTPEDWPYLDKRAALVLAGHTHGGQIHLPGLGSLINTPWYDRKYARGFIREEERTLFVTTGLGSAYTQARLFTPPEVIYITLKTLHKK